jgi:hypothetical protein
MQQGWVIKRKATPVDKVEQTHTIMQLHDAQPGKAPAARSQRPTRWRLVDEPRLLSGWQHAVTLSPVANK